MACTCKTTFNKNVINRLHPEIDESGEKVYLVYIRGNKANPLGVIDRLYEFGGVNGLYTSNDLMDSSNLFYIDYKNNKRISFVADSEMVAEAILTCWEEIYPSANLTYTPEDWDNAIIDYPAAQLYEDGKDETTNNEIKIVGKLKILRDIYRKGWTPSPNDSYYYIAYRNNYLDRGKGTSWSRFLSFQDEETRDIFYDTYKDLISQVKTYI